MKIPRKVFVLGFTKNPDAMERTCAEVERIGLTPIRHWNFPTPYTKFVQKHIVNANKAMKHSEAFFNSGWGHYSILSVARDLGDVPVFVVEDDCRFLKDVDALSCALECAPDDADLLLLDSFGAARSQEKFMNERRNAVHGWAKVSAARSAAAYIVGPRYVNRLISLGDRCTRGKKARIFDQWFENRWLDDANIYCAVPNLAVQAVDPTAANRPSAVSNRRKYMEMGIDMDRYAAW